MAKFSGIACDGCGKPITDKMAQFSIVQNVPGEDVAPWKDGKGKPVPMDACSVPCVRKASVRVESAAREVAKAAKAKAAAAKS